jgi:hypothetical protein
MPKYNITASRETYYEFEIEADTEIEAIEEMNRIEISENVEDYAYDWFPLEVTDIEEVEE